MELNEVLATLELCKAICMVIIFAAALYAAWRTDKALAERDYYKQKFHQASKQHMEDVERDKYER